MPVGGLRASDPHFIDLADPAPRNAHPGRGLHLGAQGEEDLRARHRAPALSAAARHLEAALAAAPDAAARRRLLSRAVACRLAAAGAPDPAVLGVVRLLGQPRASVSEAARHAHLSGRQLRRRFADHVGLPPKALQAVLRFQRLRVQLASPGTARVTLARAAADCGYFDQAHLCHDSARLAGVTPAELLCPRPQPTAGTRPEPSALPDELVPGRPRRPGAARHPTGSSGLAARNDSGHGHSQTGQEGRS
jgi:AraC-like DNA-binding protein